MKKKAVPILLAAAIIFSAGGCHPGMEQPEESQGGVSQGGADAVGEWKNAVESNGQLLQHLNLDANGDEDDTAYVSTYDWGDGDGYASATVLQITLGTGQELTQVYTGFYQPTLQAGYLQQTGKQNIVLELEERFGHLGEAQLYVLEVYQEDAAREGRLQQVLELRPESDRMNPYPYTIIPPGTLISGAEVVDNPDRGCDTLVAKLHNDINQDATESKGMHYRLPIDWSGEEWVMGERQPGLLSQINLKQEYNAEPPLDEYDWSAAVPSFLTREQQLLYLQARSLYQHMWGGDTTGIDRYPRADGSTVSGQYSSVELDGINYTVARGRYKNWTDFESTILSVFTKELFDSSNEIELGPIYLSHQKQLYIIDIGRGSNECYNTNFPDDFELISQTEEKIQFNVIGHFSQAWYPIGDETSQEVSERLNRSYDYTMSVPVEMVKQDGEWRFSEFELAINANSPEGNAT